MHMQVTICNVIMHHCIMHNVRMVSRSLCYERALLRAPVLGARCFVRLCQARIHSHAFGSKQYIAAQLLKCLVANIALVVYISILICSYIWQNSHIYFFILADVYQEMFAHKYFRAAGKYPFKRR